MIAQTFPLKQLVKMFRSSELKVVPIVSGSGEVGVPAEYMLYGGAINRYSQALSVLRDVCDEITWTLCSCAVRTARWRACSTYSAPRAKNAAWNSSPETHFRASRRIYTL